MKIYKKLTNLKKKNQLIDLIIQKKKYFIMLIRQLEKMKLKIKDVN